MLYSLRSASRFFIPFLAQAILKEAEDALYNAEEAACAILGPKSDSDEDESLVDKLPPLSSVSGVSDEDLSPLESIARKARSAGSTLPQVSYMTRTHTHTRAMMASKLCVCRSSGCVHGAKSNRSCYLFSARVFVPTPYCFW